MFAGTKVKINPNPSVSDKYSSLRPDSYASCPIWQPCPSQWAWGCIFFSTFTFIYSEFLAHRINRPPQEATSHFLEGLRELAVYCTWYNSYCGSLDPEENIRLLGGSTCSMFNFSQRVICVHNNCIWISDSISIRYMNIWYPIFHGANW